VVPRVRHMKSEPQKTAGALFALPDGDLERGFLVGARCSECGTVVFPKRPVCPHCMAQGTMVETPLSKVATLYSYSINEMAPEGFQAPYITGKVDLPERVRIFTLITGCDPSESSLEIGMRMGLVFKEVAAHHGGCPIVRYAYEPRTGRDR
jgi:uncharacterized OB-fold protein